MHLLLLLWKSKLKTHEQTNTTFTQFFFYLIKKKKGFLVQEKKRLYTIQLQKFLVDLNHFGSGDFYCGCKTFYKGR